jgi:hypothetical protein
VRIPVVLRFEEEVREGAVALVRGANTMAAVDATRPRRDEA